MVVLLNRLDRFLDPAVRVRGVDLGRRFIGIVWQVDLHIPRQADDRRLLLLRVDGHHHDRIRPPLVGTAERPGIRPQQEDVDWLFRRQLLRQVGLDPRRRVHRVGGDADVTPSHPDKEEGHQGQDPDQRPNHPHHHLAPVVAVVMMMVVMVMLGLLILLFWIHFNPPGSPHKFSRPEFGAACDKT